MPKDIHQRDTAQQRSSRLLLAMGIIVLLGALAYFVLTLVVNRRAPASPDTRYTPPRTASPSTTSPPSGRCAR